MDSFSNKLKILLGPIITSWAFFLVHLSIFGSELIFFRLRKMIYILAITLLLLSTPILVTLSFEKKKYCIYLAGVICCLIVKLIFLIYMIAVCVKEKVGGLLIIPALEFIELIVLMIYKNKVKKFLNNDANLRENLVNNSPANIEPINN